MFSCRFSNNIFSKIISIIIITSFLITSVDLKLAFTQPLPGINSDKLAPSSVFEDLANTDRVTGFALELMATYGVQFLYEHHGKEDIIKEVNEKLNMAFENKKRMLWNTSELRKDLQRFGPVKFTNYEYDNAAGQKLSAIFEFSNQHGIYYEITYAPQGDYEITRTDHPFDTKISPAFAEGRKSTAGYVDRRTADQRAGWVSSFKEMVEDRVPEFIPPFDKLISDSRIILVERSIIGTSLPIRIEMYFRDSKTKEKYFGIEISKDDKASYKIRYRQGGNARWSEIPGQSRTSAKEEIIKFTSAALEAALEMTDTSRSFRNTRDDRTSTRGADLVSSYNIARSEYEKLTPQDHANDPAKVRPLRDKMNRAREELWLESQKETVKLADGTWPKLETGAVFCDLITKEIFVSKKIDKGLKDKIQKGLIVKLTPSSISNEARTKRDELRSQLQDDKDQLNRRNALIQLKEMEESGLLPEPYPVPDIFTHCHTTYSYGPTPELVAWRAYQLGLGISDGSVVGIVDHNTNKGIKSWREACRIVGIKNHTAGFEVRMKLAGTEFENMEINFPGVKGEAYIVVHAVDEEGAIELLENIRLSSIGRFKRTIDYLNKDILRGLNTSFKFDYDDVKSLTEKEAENPTERHLAEAIAQKIIEKVKAKDRAAFLKNFISEFARYNNITIELSERDLNEGTLSDSGELLKVIRNKLIVPMHGIEGLKPDDRECPSISDVTKLTGKRGWKAYYPLLGGGVNACEAERPENRARLMKYLQGIDIDGIAFMPDRNTEAEKVYVENVSKEFAEGQPFAGMDVNDLKMAYTGEFSAREDFGAGAQRIMDIERKALSAKGIKPAELVMAANKAVDSVKIQPGKAARMSFRSGDRVIYIDNVTGKRTEIDLGSTGSIEDINIKTHLAIYEDDPKASVIVERNSPLTQTLGEMWPTTPDFVALLKERGYLPRLNVINGDGVSAIRRYLPGHTVAVTRDGVLATGSNFLEARYRAEILESSAITAVVARLFKGEKYLTKEDALRLLESYFERFRQAALTGEKIQEEEKLEPIKVGHNGRQIAELRRQLMEAGRNIAKRGLVVGPGGNTSVCTPDRKIMLIKASGKAFENMGPDDYVGIDIATGRPVIGLGEYLKSSTETSFHRAIYIARKDVFAVAHTHPSYTTGIATAGSFVKYAGGWDYLINYMHPGGGIDDELASAVRNGLKDGRTGILMGNHGAITTGKTLEEALSLNYKMEEAAIELTKYELAHSTSDDPAMAKLKEILGVPISQDTRVVSTVKRRTSTSGVATIPDAEVDEVFVTMNKLVTDINFLRESTRRRTILCTDVNKITLSGNEYQVLTNNSTSSVDLENAPHIVEAIREPYELDVEFSYQILSGRNMNEQDLKAFLKGFNSILEHYKEGRIKSEDGSTRIILKFNSLLIVMNVSKSEEETDVRNMEVKLARENSAFQYELQVEPDGTLSVKGGSLESGVGIAERSSTRGVKNTDPVKIFLNTKDPVNAAKALLRTPPENIAVSLCGATTAFLEALKQDKPLLLDLKTFYQVIRRLMPSALDSRYSPELRRQLYIMTGQAENILSWIERGGIPEAENMGITLNPEQMVKSPDKDRGPSYLYRGGMAQAAGEGKNGIYWRGFEGLKKIGEENILEETVEDAGLLEPSKEYSVMYLMNHGFIAVPEAISKATEDGVISTIHETSFIEDVIPGTSQTTSTGPGHFQGTSLDIKYVTAGRGIQYNKIYDSKGKLVHVLAQRLEPGTWTFALPGAVDSVENGGGLRFNDFSMKVPAEMLQELNPWFNFNDLSKVESILKDNLKSSPYVVQVVRGSGYHVVKRDEEAPDVLELILLNQEKYQEALFEAPSVIELYKSLSEGRIPELISNIQKKVIEPVRIAERRRVDAFSPILNQDTKTAVKRLYNMAAVGAILENGTKIAAKDIFRITLDDGGYHVDSQNSDPQHSGRVRNSELPQDMRTALDILDIAPGIHKTALTGKNRENIEILINNLPLILKKFLEDLIPRAKNEIASAMVQEFFRQQALIRDGDFIVPKLKSQRIDILFGDLILSIGICEEAKIADIDILSASELETKPAYSLRKKGDTLSLSYMLSRSERPALVALFSGRKAVKATPELEKELRDILIRLEKKLNEAPEDVAPGIILDYFRDNCRECEAMINQVKEIALELGLGEKIDSLIFPRYAPAEEVLKGKEESEWSGIIERHYYGPAREVIGVLRNYLDSRAEAVKARNRITDDAGRRSSRRLSTAGQVSGRVAAIDAKTSRQLHDAIYELMRDMLELKSTLEDERLAWWRDNVYRWDGLVYRILEIAEETGVDTSKIKFPALDNPVKFRNLFEDKVGDATKELLYLEEYTSSMLYAMRILRSIIPPEESAGSAATMMPVQLPDAGIEVIAVPLSEVSAYLELIAPEAVSSTLPGNEFDNLPLKGALKDIAKKSGYTFVSAETVPVTIEFVPGAFATLIPSYDYHRAHEEASRNLESRLRFSTSGIGDINKLLGRIAEIPGLKENLKGTKEENIEYLRGLVIKTNEDGYYRSRGKAPLSVMMSGELARLVTEIKDEKDIPLYYTITVSGDVDFGKDPKHIVKGATDLARDMSYKNPLAGVLYEGGKTVLYIDGNNYAAVTAVYGDRELYEKGYVIAKGGVRIFERPGSNVTMPEVKNAVSGYIQSFTDLGTLGRNRMEGPDMRPNDNIDVQDVMEYIDELGLQAAKDLGIELLPFTTGGRPEHGYISHDEWRITSLSVLESLCALLDIIGQDEELAKKFGIDLKEPVTLIVQGFGEVGSNLIRLLVEDKRFQKYNFKVVGISDKNFAFYNKDGLSLETLKNLADERRKPKEESAQENILQSLKPYEISRDELIFKPCTVLAPAAGSYVIKDLKDASRLKCKILAPGANSIFGREDATPETAAREVAEIEKYLLKNGIISLPSWMINFGGIAGSKEEVMHRYLEGGLEEMVRPDKREWLKAHVLGGDVSDVAWVNTFWQMYLWKKEGYRRPLNEIMQERAYRILAKEKEILLKYPDDNPTLREIVERKDTATILAKSYVLLEDLGDDINSMRASLSDRNAPEIKRRVAAYLMGTSGNEIYTEDLLKVLEYDGSRGPESGAVYRNAAIGLGYLLEERLKNGRNGEIENIIKRIHNIKDISEGKEMNEDEYERNIWVEWILRKVNGEALTVDKKSGRGRRSTNGIAGPPIIFRPDDKDAVIRHRGWDGFGISYFLGMVKQRIAEIWFNSTQRDGLSKIPGKNVTLKELIDRDPVAMLGPGMTAKPIFCKIMGKDGNQPQMVHMGFNGKIEKVGKEQFMKWAIQDRQLVVQLKDRLQALHLTKEQFEEYKKPYEEWVRLETEASWQIDKLPGLPSFMKNFDTGIFDAMRDIRKDIVSVLNVIKLEPGQVILSPAGYIHSIVGSHQAHPPSNNPEAKNEAWYIFSIGKDEHGKDRLLYFEPQQTSNATYSPFDFPAAIVWSKDNKPDLRKDLRGEGLDKVLEPGETAPATEEEAIHIMCERCLKFEPSRPEDFIVNLQDRIREVTGDYDAPDGAKVESLIEGAYPVWPTELFTLHRITLNGSGTENGAHIAVNPLETFHELVVIKGTVTLQMDGKEEVLTPGCSIFVPAAYKEPIIIKSEGEAEVLRLYPPQPTSIVIGRKSTAGGEEVDIEALTGDIKIAAHDVGEELRNKVVAKFEAGEAHLVFVANSILDIQAKTTIAGNITSRCKEYYNTKVDGYTADVVEDLEAAKALISKNQSWNKSNTIVALASDDIEINQAVLKGINTKLLAIEKAGDGKFVPVKTIFDLMATLVKINRPLDAAKDGEIISWIKELLSKIKSRETDINALVNALMVAEQYEDPIKFAKDFILKLLPDIRKLETKELRALYEAMNKVVESL